MNKWDLFIIGVAVGVVMGFVFQCYYRPVFTTPPYISATIICKNSAFNCANELAIDESAKCSYCESDCAYDYGKDAMSDVQINEDTCPFGAGGTATACSYCKQGLIENIHY